MNFDFSPEQQAFRQQLRSLLGDLAPMAEARRVLDGHAPYSERIWTGLARIGALGAAIPEDLGGAGLGALELCIAAEELGRVLAPAPFGPSILLAAEALRRFGSPEQQRRHLPAIASGDLIATFADGRRGPASERLRRDGEGRVRGTRLAVPDAEAAGIAVVVAIAPDERPTLCVVSLDQPTVRRSPIEVIDPVRPHATVEFDGALAEPLTGGAKAVEQLTDAAATFIAFEQIGGADRALEAARDYALQRTAFGRQVGSFQAIKHMLADMYVAVTLARSNAYYAAWALSTGAAELPAAAAAARVSATKAFQLCAKNSTQVFGAMGFTWEADCHLFYRRAHLLGLQLGALPEWEDRLIEQLSQRNDRGLRRHAS